jgi:hypothetical protein
MVELEIMRRMTCARVRPVRVLKNEAAEPTDGTTPLRMPHRQR